MESLQKSGGKAHGSDCGSMSKNGDDVSDMSDFWKKHIGKGISFAIGLVIAVAAALFESSQYKMIARNMVRVASDGCFTAAVMLIGIGLLGFIDGFGGFDHIFYLCRLLFEKMIPSKTKFEERVNYLTYVQMRREKHKKKTGGVKNMLFAGAIYLAAAIVLMLIFEK